MSASDPKQAGDVQLEQKRALLRRLMAERESRTQAVAPPLTRMTQGPKAPLSFIQQAIWFLQELDPRSSAYNESGLAELQGPLRVPALEQALSELIRRHTPLRTTFEQQDGELVQVIHEPAPVRLEVVELSELSEADRRAKLWERVRHELDRPFDLRQGPPVRFTLMRMSATEHFLLTVAHHIVTDGSSFVLYYNELLALYDAFHAGRASPLPEPQFQYTDYALWQRSHLAGKIWEQHLDFWKQTLANPEPLRLPTDRPRPPSLSTRGAIFESRPLPQELTEALRKLASAEGVTLFMLLEAAFKVLLFRYTGQMDISVGISHAGRTRDTEQVFGCFINTLVLRSKLSGDPSFRELVARVKRTSLEAYSRALTPFHHVVAAIKPERDPSRLPLFDVLFDVRGRWVHLKGEQLSLRSEPILPTMPKCDIAFAFVEDEGTLRSSFIYSEDLFDCATIERMAEQLEVLLQGIVEAPHLRLSQLPMLSRQEREHLLVRLNDTQVESPLRRLHELVEDQAAQSADAQALVFQGRSMTYRALNERANQLAHHLRKRGVGPDVAVAVCVERGPDLIVAALAALKAGGVYVPIDPTLPANRAAFILEDTWAPFLLTQYSVLDQLERTAAYTFCMEDWEPLEGEPRSNPSPVGSPRDLAYIIYTSGSTGKPKGVLIEHASACNTLAQSVRDCAVSGGSRMLQFASAGFDVSVKETFTALACGATLVLGSKDEMVPGASLSRLVREQRVTHLILTPQVLASLSPAELPEVQVIVIGGEPCPPELMDRWAAGRRFVSEYGPTEASITATVAVCSPGSGRPPLGRPSSNTRIYVLDPAMQPLPMNIPGELYIGGAGVGRGYLNRPELTAEHFVPDPFSGVSGARLYRTGDLVRHRSNGQLEFVGRADHQIKLRGFRIELGEIEAALRRQVTVKDAAVVVREETPGRQQLVAYVTPRSHVPPDPQDLRAALREELPDYMVPASLMVLEELPLTPNGKLDRKALPAPSLDRAGARSERGDEPRGPVEQKLAAMWMRLLGLERVGREDDFFELGGHSILAGQVADQIREELFVEIPVRMLFEHTTLSALAGCVQGLLESGEHVIMAPLERRTHGAVRPLSYAQEQLWKLITQCPGSSIYHVVDAYRVPAMLEEKPLRSAWDEVYRRHDVLRATFTSEAGGPVQRISPPGPAPLEVHDLSHLPSAERELEIHRHVEEATSRPFDLAQAPPVRAKWLRCGPAEHALILVMHQLVTDAASMDVLLEELLTLHDAFRAGLGSPLSEPALQYADYASWQRGWLTGAMLERELGYWRAQLSALPPPLQLPLDRLPPAQPTARTALTARINFSAELTTALRGVCQQENATPFMLLTAAFYALLARLSGEEDILVGSPVLGRNRSELQRAVGLFINVVVLRARVSPVMSFRQLLATLRNGVLDAFGHQALPLELIAEALHAERHPVHAPFFQALISMHTTEALRTPGGAARIDRLPGRSGAATCTLSLRGFDDTDGMGIQFEYDTDVLEQATATRMLEGLGSLLHRVAHHAGAPLMELLREAR
jgi:amino acid adenylation domain-containing protein